MKPSLGKGVRISELRSAVRSTNRKKARDAKTIPVNLFSRAMKGIITANTTVVTLLFSPPFFFCSFEESVLSKFG